jgi:hypothetical protein
MAGGGFRVFLSDVSSEFEQVRAHGASDLRTRGLLSCGDLRKPR